MVTEGEEPSPKVARTTQEGSQMNVDLDEVGCGDKSMAVDPDVQGSGKAGTEDDAVSEADTEIADVKMSEDEDTAGTRGADGDDPYKAVDPKNIEGGVERRGTEGEASGNGGK
jgi:hypothetical protein